MRLFIGFAAVMVLSAASIEPAEAQLFPRRVYYAAPPVTYVQPLPAPVVQTTYVQPTVVYRPVVPTYAPVVNPVAPAVYAAPQPVLVARPTIPVTVVQPAPVVTTRYRPILGGAVTRTWYP